MILFCLDASGPVAGVAIIKDGQLRYEAMANSGLTHSQSILPMAEEAYLRAGVKMEDTDYFAVTVGPGSFTGVRIGVSTVKGLAHALSRPCVAVDALEAMAAGAMPFSGVICPLQDARAGQVYAAAFEGGTVIVNHRSVPVALPAGKKALAQQEHAEGWLPAHSAACLLNE